MHRTVTVIVTDKINKYYLKKIILLYFMHSNSYSLDPITIQYATILVSKQNLVLLFTFSPNFY